MLNELSCDVVADYFLLHVDPLAGDTISNLKLQKLCYYAQAWSLAHTDKPLFAERIEAWTHGPAVPSLYRRFKAYGAKSIDPLSAIITDPLRDLHTDHMNLLDGVWLRYGHLSGTQLRNLTHSERPWIEARGGVPPTENCTVEISHEAMKAFYRPMLDSEHDADSRAKTSSAAA